MDGGRWETFNPEGRYRIIVTRRLPGARWLEILKNAGCRVDVCVDELPLGPDEIGEAIGERCDGAVGQLNEPWRADLLAALKSAGGRVYGNYAVGYDNVDVAAATRLGIPVGNTPGVLTEATAELAVALTFAAARRLVEGDRFMRAGRFEGWRPSLFLGELLRRKTVGVVGAGRIGTAYARMMVEGHKMNLVYFSRGPKERLERIVASYGDFLASVGESPVTCRRAGSVEDVLREGDVVSLHASLNESTRHLIDRERLGLMKENAVLVNTGRGPLIDEAALVEHCRANPSFTAGLDVFEDEPAMKPGLAELPNVVLSPHVGSATGWSREAMAVLSAFNTAGVLKNLPVWRGHDVSVFLGEKPPRAVPSIVNAGELGLPLFDG
jgi:glycerate dehydrogenase